MIFVIKLMAYFIIYSFIGWLIESVFKSYLQKKLVNSGFLEGPICPIYGIGALIMYAFLNNYKANLILVFVLGFIVLSIWEYIVGWFLEKMFNTKYWDYTGNFMNIKGRVCLFNSTAWGVLSVIFISVLHPFFSEKIDLIPENILIILVSVISLLIFIDMIISIIKTKALDKKLQKINELTQSIREKLSELNNLKLPTGDYRKNIQDVIDKLQEQRDKLKYNVTKQTNRLKKAFPTMKSEKISNFLNQKLDEIKEIKDRIK